MTHAHAICAPAPASLRWILAEQPASGTIDDGDDRDDEHDAENEAPIRELDENTEAPEEFEVDDEDELGLPEDDDADEEDKAPPR